MIKMSVFKRGLVSAMMTGLLLSFNAVPSFASDAPTLPKQEDKKSSFRLEGENLPITITSKHLEGDNKKNTARFSGNVVAKRGDITISCESISIIYDKEAKTAEKIIAEENVKIIQGARMATGSRAVFIHSEDKIIMTGSPKVQEGQNIIEGARIILYLAEDRVVVESDTEEQIKAIIHLERDI